MEASVISPKQFCPRVAETSGAPERLFVLGDVSVLARSAITVVGTRRPTADGLRAAFRFGRGIAASGIAVVSGLARGVDTKAHEGAIAAGGVTVAVLAHGLDRIYPPENRGLARRILDTGGCLVTEYPPGTPPHRGHFPARNRILSALSWATVVIEAGEEAEASSPRALLSIREGKFTWCRVPSTRLPFREATDSFQRARRSSPIRAKCSAPCQQSRPSRARKWRNGSAL